MNETIFLKLGGSLITDKTQAETIRPNVVRRIAAEIAAARAAMPSLRLLLGHGSGSFGHVAAAKYGTRGGVNSAEQWRGFAEVAAAAARLNAIMVDALLEAGVPVLSLTSHGSAHVEDGKITHINHETIVKALDAGLVPLVMGDVAFDTVRGGTIISTEEIFTFLAAKLQPSWLLLAGETNGVYDLNREVIPLITHQTLPHIREALGGSRGIDVTGGMLTKVQTMLALVEQHPQLSIRIFSGLASDSLKNALTAPQTPQGTRIS
ncbi:MAG: isopentenyl phosphate kinase [Candidatus Promineifilaceae bacterium]